MQMACGAGGPGLEDCAFEASTSDVRVADRSGLELSLLAICASEACSAEVWAVDRSGFELWLFEVCTFAVFAW